MFRQGEVMIKHLFWLMLLLPQVGSLGTLTRTYAGSACPGAVSCWPSNEGIGAIYDDKSGNNNNITVSNPSAFVWEPNPPPFQGNYPSYAGGTSIPGATSAISSLTNFSGATPISIHVWAPEAAFFETFTYLSNSETSSPFQGMELQNTEGIIRFDLINAFPSNYLEVQTSTTYSSTISYLAVTYNGLLGASAVVTISVNGSPVATTTVSNTLTGSAATGLPLYIAQNPDGTNLIAGAMGEMTICPSVTSPSRITLNYNGGVPILPQC
jgi:Concanavalin A-like lectin/glucanases superfamily